MASSQRPCDYYPAPQDHQPHHQGEEDAVASSQVSSSSLLPDDHYYYCSEPSTTLSMHSIDEAVVRETLRGLGFNDRSVLGDEVEHSSSSTSDRSRSRSRTGAMGSAAMKGREGVGPERVDEGSSAAASPKGRVANGAEEDGAGQLAQPPPPLPLPSSPQDANYDMYMTRLLAAQEMLRSMMQRQQRQPADADDNVNEEDEDESYYVEDWPHPTTLAGRAAGVGAPGRQPTSSQPHMKKGSLHYDPRRVPPPAPAAQYSYHTAPPVSSSGTLYSERDVDGGGAPAECRTAGGRGGGWERRGHDDEGHDTHHHASCCCCSSSMAASRIQRFHQPNTSYSSSAAASYSAAGGVCYPSSSAYRPSAAATAGYRCVGHGVGVGKSSSRSQDVWRESRRQHTSAADGQVHSPRMGSRSGMKRDLPGSAGRSTGVAATATITATTLHPRQLTDRVQLAQYYRSLWQRSEEKRESKGRKAVWRTRCMLQSSS